MITMGVLVPSVVAFVIIAAPIAYHYFEKFKDRPLASGYEYTGRYYQDRCPIKYIEIGIWCGMSPERNEYFYATDIPPVKLADNFPGWQLEKEEEDDLSEEDQVANDILGDEDGSKQEIYFGHVKSSETPVEDYRIHSSSDHVSYRSYLNPGKVIDNEKLRKTNKRYLISIHKTDYEKLTGLRSDPLFREFAL